MKHSKILTFSLITTLCLILMSFSTEEIGRPKTGINHTFTKDLSLSSLKGLEELSIDAQGEDLTVISFRFVVAPRTGMAYMKTFKGDRIYGNALERVKKASVGDRILVDEVLAQYSNGLKTYCDPAMHMLVE